MPSQSEPLVTADGGEHQRPIPLGQLVYDDLFLLFTLGIVITLVSYTIWGLINLASTPFSS